jgi:hypothetical protein
MKLTCAWKNGSTQKNGEHKPPDKCGDCPGEFRRSFKQLPEFRKTCPLFLPDVETIMKICEKEERK